MSNYLWSPPAPPTDPFPFPAIETDDDRRLFLRLFGRPFEVKGGDFLPSRRSKWQATW